MADYGTPVGNASSRKDSGYTMPSKCLALSRGIGHTMRRLPVRTCWSAVVLRVAVAEGLEAIGLVDGHRDSTRCLDPALCERGRDPQEHVLFHR